MKRAIAVLTLAIMVLAGSVQAEEYSVRPMEIIPPEHTWKFTPGEVKRILIDYLAKRGIKIPKGKSSIYGIENRSFGHESPSIRIEIDEAIK